ncbi:MAG TPA: SDR family NAD(P)-dependent oxidoreductase, partial [Rhodothermales bacterium]|nr:SDR family NAD(P)-dependent oxidoreductase [Rhodothermales bacterium]
YTETEDGYETTWAVNHLAPFLLTNLLLDIICASAPARIVNISSESHQGSTIHFDDPNLTGHYGWIKAYAQSKLANVLFTYELARRLEGTGVTANVMHPGVVATNIWNRNKTPLDYLLRLFKIFYMSPRKSGKAVVRLAVSPDLDGVTGTYFNVDKPARSTSVSYDEDVAQRLWDLSEEMTRLA